MDTRMLFLLYKEREMIFFLVTRSTRFDLRFTEAMM